MPESLAGFLSLPVLLFLVFALGAVSTALSCVLSPNPVRSALFLVLNLFCVAVLYLLLNAYFLAAVQIIVYAGAIMVLFLFVIMLLNLGSPERVPDRMKWQQPAALGAGIVLAAMLSVTIASSIPPLAPAKSPIGADTPRLNAVGAAATSTADSAAILEATARDPETMGTTYGIGKNLYDPTKPWLFPFEVTSVLLLVAVIGSVSLAGRRTPEEMGQAAMAQEGMRR